MELFFEGALEGLEQGLQIMAKELGFTVSEAGIMVKVSRGETLRASFDGKAAEVTYHKKHQFFRELSILLPKMKAGEVFTHEETAVFSTNGAMFDASRNAVPTVESCKFFLRKMALMGLNMMMLYTEDTYEVPEYPYFGYMRGRYTEAELRELDDYADNLGIEIIPCIQTLGHLMEALKWRDMAKFRDTQDVLLCDDEDTYALLEKMLRHACAPFRTDRIHIGMDEAHDLGLGRYLKQNGYVPGFEIINRHLARVTEMLTKMGKTPMIWSDMYFRLASKTGSYYDTEPIPQEVLDLVPPEIQMVYWDYYSQDEEKYRTFLKKHQQFHNKVIFAGGVWTWAGTTVHYGQAFRNSIPALNQCRACGIEEVFTTLWGDDGAETDMSSALLGLQLYAEYGYSGEVTMYTVCKRFEDCVFEPAENFLAMSLLDVTSAPAEDGLPNLEDSNFSKTLLYQDVLMGLFDDDIRDMDFTSHFAALEQKYADILARETKFPELFQVSRAMADFLSVKADLGKEIYSAYHSGDRAALEVIAEETIPCAVDLLETLRTARRALWFQNDNPFGYEVLDIRLGGVRARLETAGYRLEEYLTGHIQRIEELEETRLPFLREKKDSKDTFRSYNGWSRIVTASPIQG